MPDLDKRNRLEEMPYSCKACADGKLLIYWQGKLVKTLTGQSALKVMASIEGVDDVQVQLVLARATGHFKHGNEKINNRR
jgi:hypothetical protein